MAVEQSLSYEFQEINENASGDIVGARDRD